MVRIAALLPALLAVSSAHAGAPVGKLGLFTVRLAPGLKTSLPTDKLVRGMSDLLRDDLQQANVGQVELLAWPDRLPAADRPTYETFLGTARAAGCRGALVVTIAGIEFSEQTARVPLVGEVRRRKARLQLTGGLLDMTTGAAVANLDVTEERDSEGRGGGNPNATIGAGPGTALFDDSPMGEALAALRPAVVKLVSDNLERLSPASAGPPPRADAPRDVAFEQASWIQPIQVGYGQRAVVAVVNRGAAPRSFVVVPIAQPDGIIADLLGEGSRGEPCTLAPGQWKYVRLILNMPAAVDERKLELGIVSAAAGQAPNLGGRPVDRAVITLDHKVVPRPEVEFKIIGQDPVTLVYTCQVLNRTHQGIDHLRLRAEPDDGRVTFSPTFRSDGLRGLAIPPDGSLTFEVIPHFEPGVRAFDVTLQGYLGIHQTRQWPLRFEIPEGKDVYLGAAHSIQYMTDDFNQCVNQGDTLVDWGSFNGKMHFKCVTDRDLPLNPETDIDPSEDFKGTLMLSWTWYTLLELLGLDRPQEPRESFPDVRGATIRPLVAQRLANLDRDSSDHPMASTSKDWYGLVWYRPSPTGPVRIWFAGLARDRGRRDAVGIGALSAPDHDARWPYLRARYDTSQAYVVWEDAAPRRRSDTAFRASGEAMNHWRETIMLTDHGQGVDDPVVHVNGQAEVGVAWSDRRDGAQRVYLRLSHDDGRTFAPEVAMPGAAGDRQYWPQFAYAPDGLQAIWASHRGDEQQIVTCALDAEGKPVGEPVALSRAGGARGEPQIAVGPDGARYAVWREGDGADSEIQFASSPGPAGPWTAPRPLSDDEVYSEYPLIIVRDGVVWSTWHADSPVGEDLKQYVRSTDGGRTWSAPKSLPSLSNVTEQAWLACQVELEWPRSEYKPFDLVVSVGGQEVGRLTQVIPDGTYLFDVPPELVPSIASRLPGTDVSIKAEGCGGAHYILAQNVRLIVRRRFSQVQVIAASQTEADRLAASAGPQLNHDQPDLILCANEVTALPDVLAQGDSLDLPLRVANLGAAPASGVTVTAYDADPRGAGPGAAAAVVGTAAVGEIQPGETRTARVKVTGKLFVTPVLYLAVTAREPDAFEGDNLWIEHFTAGAEPAPTPLLGTDVPDVLYAPSLLPTVRIPNPPALRNLLAQPDLARLLGRGAWPLPPAPSLDGYLQRALDGVHLPGLPTVPNVPSVPVPNVPVPRPPRLPGLP